MQPLERTLRSQLERSVRQARRVGEQAARAALDALGVADASVPPHLDEEQRVLRRRLRAHARSLGDTFRNGGSAPERLIAEVAYEHWHRMLFARFLAENDLLMYDGVAITLEECAELAAEEGGGSGWELAARLAAKLLPQVFRVDSPVFVLRLAPDDQRALEGLLAGLAPEVFQASDSLGWVYQFWQADAKDRINQSEVKIGARELPAVTQLFTEPYMVSFLLDNALGAWWAARRLTEADRRNASSEEELRRKAAIPGVPLDYLRFVRAPSPDPDEGEIWTPAAGCFDAWPEQLSELKVLDPCCGSGHFLVAVLLMLTPMRVELEGLSASGAIDAVLRENLHGLEIDQRCIELAAFALALTAWRYPGAGGYRPLPELHLACSGLPVAASKEEWKQLGLGRQNLSIALDWMHDTFRNAPVLGSLLNPATTAAAKVVRWEDLAGFLEQALAEDTGDEGRESAVMAYGLAKAAPLLAGQYHWVVTNVPYLARGKQSEVLRQFCERHYPAAKNDLATVFLDRCREFVRKPQSSRRHGDLMLGGTVSLVLPQNWLFLTSYRKLREKLLTDDTWHLLARLGPGAFETISGEVVKAILIHLSAGNTRGSAGRLFDELVAPRTLRGLDVSTSRTSAEKAAALLVAEIKSVQQAKQLENPDARVKLEETEAAPLLESLAAGVHGLGTKDSLMFIRNFWEFSSNGGDWEFMQSATQDGFVWSGMESIVWWENGRGELQARSAVGMAILAGGMAHGKPGVLVSQVRSLQACLYAGGLFEKNAAVISFSDISLLAAIWSYCTSEQYRSSVRSIDQKVAVTNKTLVKVPFDLDHWTKVAEERYPNGLPQPYTDDPTQWIFHGHPCGSVIWDEETKRTAHGPVRTDETVLQVAVARLLGYRWPAEVDPAMELAEEQREWVRQCDALLPLTDTDGIVCIPPVRGEARVEERLLNLLAAAYDDAWSADTLSRLLASADHAGKSLESWLRDKFFAQHCKLFQQRPFIWQIWDGLRDGFSVLVNYHKLGRKNLETLIYTYLGDWIRSQRDDLARGVDGAQEKLDAAEALQRRLEQILEGEAPYDIFVRWKPIEEQPIGWNPDLNDGVRLNIRPFLTVDDVGRKGAGILRDKPNIHWNKDRGKDVESAPWFHRFKAERINDHHLSLDEKRRARN